MEVLASPDPDQRHPEGTTPHTGTPPGIPAGFRRMSSWSLSTGTPTRTPPQAAKLGVKARHQCGGSGAMGTQKIRIFSSHAREVEGLPPVRRASVWLAPVCSRCAAAPRRAHAYSVGVLIGLPRDLRGSEQLTRPLLQARELPRTLR